MYDIIAPLVSGSDGTIVAIAGVIVILLFAELSIMISKIFRFFVK